MSTAFLRVANKAYVLQEVLSPRLTEQTGYQPLHALPNSLDRLCREPIEFDRNALWLFLLTAKVTVCSKVLYIMKPQRYVLFLVHVGDSAHFKFLTVTYTPPPLSTIKNGIMRF